MMKLHNLKPNPKARHRRKRVARGESSGHGKTAGRGGKGQTARSGSGGRADFEGGQTPIMRRLPKFGFNSHVHEDRREAAIVNLEDLNQFPAKAEVNLQAMKDGKLIAKTALRVRVLAKGKLNHPLTIKANHFSKAALEKISEAQGKAEVL